MPGYSTGSAVPERVDSPAVGKVFRNAPAVAWVWLFAWFLGFRVPVEERVFWASISLQCATAAFTGFLATGLAAIFAFGVRLTANWFALMQASIHGGIWLVLVRCGFHGTAHGAKLWRFSGDAWRKFRARVELPATWASDRIPPATRALVPDVFYRLISH